MDTKKTRRLPPKYWWDFVVEGDEQHVLVQSDWPGGEALAIFKAPKGAKYLDVQIAKAESLISDYETGRVTPPWDIQ